MSRPPIGKVAVALMLVAGAACTRRAAVVDAARPEPAAPPVRDAAVDRPRDAQPDLPPDAEARPRGHAHRAPAARPEPAGGFKVQGDLPRADVEAVLRGARAKLDACYRNERERVPDLAGRVTFRLSVDGRGRVPLAEVVTSTLGGGDPELCMVEALRDLKFPASPSGGDSTLTFPLTFGR